VEAAGADLARLESMAFGTVSVEELLGHCREALNIVSRHADAVEFRLVSFGYVAPGNHFIPPPTRFAFLRASEHLAFCMCEICYAVFVVSFG
jgi:hypothetical protein